MLLVIISLVPVMFILAKFITILGCRDLTMRPGFAFRGRCETVDAYVATNHTRHLTNLIRRRDNFFGSKYGTIRSHLYRRDFRDQILIDLFLLEEGRSC